MKPSDVRCFAWWSKDYSKWITAYKCFPEVFKPYAHYFNFTLNTACELEPRVVPSVKERLEQMRFLVETFGVDAVVHRFDPIVVWTDASGTRKDNCGDFDFILSQTSAMGIREVVIAFYIPYPKAARRMAAAGIFPQPLTMDAKKGIMDRLLPIAAKYGVTVKCCSIQDLVGYHGIEQASCISAEKVEKLLGQRLHHRSKDRGQRKNCGCVISRDVGCYSWTCGHGCLYCYANTE